MANTQYNEIYDLVLSKLKDYDLATLAQDEIYEILHDYFLPAIVRYKSDGHLLSNRDDTAGEFNFALSDVQKEILADLMVVAYLDANYIVVPDKLKTTLASKDFNSFSAASQLAAVRVTREMYYSEATQLMRDYSYTNSKLFWPNS